MFFSVVVLVFLSMIIFLWLWCYDDNVLRSYITIKIITCYQIHPEKILCAVETLLQLELLEIRVSCLKTLEDKTSHLGTFAVNQYWRRFGSWNFDMMKMKYFCTFCEIFILGFTILQEIWFVQIRVPSSSRI